MRLPIEHLGAGLVLLVVALMEEVEMVGRSFEGLPGREHNPHRVLPFFPPPPPPGGRLSDPPIEVSLKNF